MKSWLAVGVFIWKAMSSAYAFTLNGGSFLQGWQQSELTFRVVYNEGSCTLSVGALNAAIDEAMDLINSVPTSGINLTRGGSSSTTPSEAWNTQATDSPLIVCDPNLSTTTSFSTVNNIPAITKVATTGFALGYAVVMLNAEASAAAQIANLSENVLNIILAHELVHALGLGHTNDPNSLMYFNVTQKTVLSLSQDDIDGLTFLYPRKEGLGGDGILGCGSLSEKGSGGSGMGEIVQFAGILVFFALVTFLMRQKRTVVHRG